MRARTVLAGVIVAWQVTGAPVSFAGPRTPTSTPPAPCGASASTLGSLVSGTASYVAGQYAWTDYADDDHGMNTNPARRGGGTSYPSAPYPGNTADLVQVRLGDAPTGALQVGVTMNSIVAGSPALVGIGLDTDSNAHTGASALPGGKLGSAADPLGLEQLLLLPTDGGTGTLYTWDGSNLAQAGTFPVCRDSSTNGLSATVPALRPGTATWGAIAVAGVQTAGGSWFSGAEPIMDLAFTVEAPPDITMPEQLFGELPTTIAWQDQNQADIIAGHLPVAKATVAVQFGTSRSESAPLPAPGYATFVYRSSANLGGGGPDSTQNNYTTPFKGKYQPYLVQTIGSKVAGQPAITFLHGTGGNHLSFSYEFQPGPYGPGPTTYAFDLTSASPVMIYPMGRSLSGWSDGPGQLDALEATDDAVARLRLDPERVVLSGDSAGGIGSYLIASNFPDRWTGMHSIVGSGTTRFENLTNLPVRATNGAMDPLVNVASFQQTADALAAAKTVDYQAALNFERNHAPAPMGACWYLDLLSHDRVRAPGRVRFTTPPPLVVDATRTLHPDGAYWVSGLTARDSGSASIDVTSLMLPQRKETGTIDALQNNIASGRDYCGPNPAVQTSDSWRLLGRTFGPAASTKSNGLSLTVRDTRAATIDVSTAGLDVAKTVSLTVAGDGSTTLALKGAWKGRYLIQCPSTTDEVQQAKSASLTVSRAFSSTPQTCQISRVAASTPLTKPKATSHGAGPAAVAAPSRTLAATGLPAIIPILGLGMLTTGMLIRSRRRQALA